jgi:hypothetical protein
MAGLKNLSQSEIALSDGRGVKMIENKKIKLTVEVDEDEARDLIAEMIRNRLGAKEMNSHKIYCIDVSGEIFVAMVHDNCVYFGSKDDFDRFPEIGYLHYFGKDEARLFRLFSGELQEMMMIKNVVVEYVPIDSN